MILEGLQAERIELRVAKHDTICIYQRDAMARGTPSRIGDGVCGSGIRPLRGQQTRLALQLRDLLLTNARIQSTIQHAHDCRQHQRHTEDEAQQKACSEAHSVNLGERQRPHGAALAAVRRRHRHGQRDDAPRMR